MVRLVVAGLALTIVAVEGSASSTLLAASLYLAVGLTLFFLARTTSRLDPLLPWALPLFDVPLVAFTQHLRLSEGALALGVVATSACLNLGFVVMASLSLSTRVVVVTSLCALASFSSLAFTNGLDARELDLALAAFVVTATLVAWSTSRFLPLAIELRRQAWAGRYKVGRRVGAGGMAEVFEATLQREDGLERKVALKRILPAFAARDDMQQLFLRELELASLMSHPHIVQVLDSGADESGPFLIMEFVEGCTLYKLLKSVSQRGERVPADVCFEVAEQLLRALEHIHTRRRPDGTPLGLMHRDLNPPNVIVTFAGELKVADFGIARPELEGGLTGSGELRGKAIWAAPEQLERAPLTQSLDLFAAGLILAEVAAGRHLTDGLPPAREPVLEAMRGLPALRAELGEAWWAMVTGLLQPDVAQRTASAEAALVTLRGLTWNGAEARARLAKLATDERSRGEPITLTR